MTTLLVLAMLAQPECLVSKKQVEKIVKEIVIACDRHSSIDPVLLAAIALTESGGRNIVRYKRGKNDQGADVGVFQIHCYTSENDCINRNKYLPAAIENAIKILEYSREKCKSTKCPLGWWKHYNAGSPDWILRVNDIMKRLQNHARYNPAFE